MITILFVAFVFAFVVTAIMSMSPIIWLAIAIACIALSVTVAKSKTKSLPAKVGVAALGSVLILALVLGVKIYQFGRSRKSAGKRVRLRSSRDSRLSGFIAHPRHNFEREVLDRVVQSAVALATAEFADLPGLQVKMLGWAKEDVLHCYAKHIPQNLLPQRLNWVQSSRLARRVVAKK